MDEGGAFIADHSVSLQRTEPYYQALVDLPRFVWTHSAPDKQDSDERRLVAEVGEWIGTEVLGQSILGLLLKRTKPMVLVGVPSGAERLFSLPLEIACLGNRAAADSGISFIFHSSGATLGASEPVGDRVRILALFSLPSVGSPLNLRRERQMLRSIVRRLTGAQQLAVELRVLQYVVTRETLDDVLQDGEGWDILHFSGHGQPGALLLEKTDGTADEVSAADLADMLGEARGRLKLVVLSACLSAAASLEQTLSWLGIGPETVPRREAAQSVTDEARSAPTVASALTSALDCAVLAMRYSVEDEFAINLAAELYEQLLSRKQLLPQATRLARAEAIGKPAAPKASALSAAAPSLYGKRAADLLLVPPRGNAYNSDVRLAYVPRAPDHFVGRVQAMTQASAALAMDSAAGGVLFHGMAGAGKTSCALELVYHFAPLPRFQAFVWFKAPDQGTDIALALRDFALAIERGMPGLEMVQVVDRTEALRDWLPRLEEALANNSILIVLDNMEGLLTATGQWRDDRWNFLINSLLMPGGLSRTLITSRFPPANLPASAEAIAIHALPLNETLLLARELPNLRSLLDGTSEGVTATQGRDLVRRALRLVQGHPELIKLTEAMARFPSTLSEQLTRADAAQSKSAAELDAFFQNGQTRFDPDAFLLSLHAWTNLIVEGLSIESRILFNALCAIEESDRESWIIGANWTDIWGRLGHVEPPPPISKALATLISAGLVDEQASSLSKGQSKIIIHPAVAEAGRRTAKPGFQLLVDTELAATWSQVMKESLGVHGREMSAGPMIVRAGLSAQPYLGRIGDWRRATIMLVATMDFDDSPTLIAAVLPLITRIEAITRDDPTSIVPQSLLARVLRLAGRFEEAEARFKEAISRAEAANNFDSASTAAGELATLLRDSGKPEAALQIQEKMAEFTKRAGQGPWSLLADEILRLNILNDMGRHGEVLERVLSIRSEIATLPDLLERNDRTALPWRIRELNIYAGIVAAAELENFELMLDLVKEDVKSRISRGAPRLEVARVRFNAYSALLRLNKVEETRHLLQQCRSVFEAENDIGLLGGVFGALAELENTIGNFPAAARFGADALRYAYVEKKPKQIALAHANFANFQFSATSNWNARFCHRLAALLISLATHSGHIDTLFTDVVIDIHQAGKPLCTALPENYSELCETLEKMEGVRFKEIFRVFGIQESVLSELLRKIIDQALEHT